MPPKKGQKDEQIDISSLPPWFPINVVLKFDTKKKRAVQISQKITHSFLKTVTKEDIINYAKEKGLFVDINTLNEKTRKDPKAMSELPLEMTPQIMAKSFMQLQADLNLEGRKEKKDKLEGGGDLVNEKANIAKGKNVKEEAKKDTKKGAKVVEKEQEEEETARVQEKEYKRALDIIYLLQDFPDDKQDLLELNNVKSQIDLIVYIKQKVPDITYDEDIHQEAENQEEGEEHQEIQENLSKKIWEYEQITEEDIQFIQENKQFIQLFKQERTRAAKDSTLRKAVFKDLVYEVDPFQEESSLKHFSEFLIEQICEFSLDVLQFNQWISEKKSVPLQKPDVSVLEAQIQAQKKIQADLLAQQELEKAQEDKKDTKKQPKKDTKKETKKEEKIEEVQIEKPAPEKVTQPIDDQKKEKEDKKPQQKPFHTYFKQLNTVKLEEVAPGILLEVLLDQLESDNPSSQDNQVQFQNEIDQVESILSQLESFVQYRATNSLQQHNSVNHSLNNESKGTDYKIIIDENDQILKKAIDSTLSNNEKVASRVRSLYKNMHFPGIDRWNMPAVPTKSDALRRADKSQIYPFCSTTVQEFERRESLLRFEQIMKEQDGETDFDFGDRIYVERHNKNTLTQALYRQYLFDQTVVSKYNDVDDNVYLSFYYKNPQGRQMKQKWSADWKVLPNLENWINFFKTNENNLNNTFYYDLDYEQIGNLHEYTKLLFPSDNSVIVCTKYMVGESYNYRYKVLKEGIIMGIKEDSNQQQCFYAHFDTDTRLVIDLDDFQNEQFKASASLSLLNGLVIKFLSNGDVFQQNVAHKQNKLKRDYQEIVNPHVESQSNSSIEVKRIISGKGSVIRTMKDGSVIIYYANGNISQSKSSTNQWMTTNNKGYRKTRNKDGVEQEQDPIACAKRTDPQTGSKIIVRGDQTVIIQYQDGRVLSQFQDGTEIFTSSNGEYIIVEHPNYATVKISYNIGGNQENILPAGDTTLLGRQNIFDRVYNNRIVETFCPDGTKVIGFAECHQQEDQSLKKIYNHIMYLEDGSLCRLTDSGELVFISAADRNDLNEQTQDQDLEWRQLFCGNEEKIGGVICCNLQQGLLWMQDDEGNSFQFSSNGDISYDLKALKDYNSINEEKIVRPTTPNDLQDGDFFDEEFKVLPRPIKRLPPKLFIINNDNNGMELFNENQLKNYFKKRHNQPDTITLIDNNLPNYEKCDSYSFIIRYKQQKKSNYIQCEIPKILDVSTKTRYKQDQDEKQIFLFRNLLKFGLFDADSRKKHSKDLEKYNIWKKDQLNQQQQYGIGKLNEKDKDNQFNIQLKILESRNKDYQDLNYDQVFIQYTKQFLDSYFNQKPSNLQQITYEIKQESVQPPKKKKIKKQYGDESFKKVKINLNFASNYFDTIQGSEAFNQLLLTGQVDLNPHVSKRIKSNTDQTLPLQDEIFSEKNNLEQNDPLQSQKNSQDQADPAPLNTQIEIPPQSQKTQNSKNQKTIKLKPSIFAVKDELDLNKVQKVMEDAKQYRRLRQMSQNLYGNVFYLHLIYSQERKENQTKIIPCLLKTNPISEINQQYRITESQTDTRIRISSMHSRSHLKGPGINEFRRMGNNNKLVISIDKKNTLGEKDINNILALTTGVNDALARDLLIYPVSAKFGMLKVGGMYETIITVKNEDIISQRIQLKQAQSKNVRVLTLLHGPIALGLSRQIIIRLDASAEIQGRFQDEFQIVSKHEIYKIPISANILEESLYQRYKEQQQQTINKEYPQSIVREIGITQKRISSLSSQNSDLLPKLTNFNKEYKIQENININYESQEN